MDVTKATFLAVQLDEQSAVQYAELFKEHDVTSNMLPELSLEVLKAMGISKVGHMMKILRLKTGVPGGGQTGPPAPSPPTVASVPPPSKPALQTSSTSIPKEEQPGTSSRASPSPSPAPGGSSAAKVPTQSPKATAQTKTSKSDKQRAGPNKDSTASSIASPVPMQPKVEPSTSPRPSLPAVPSPAPQSASPSLVSLIDSTSDIKDLILSDNSEEDDDEELEIPSNPAEENALSADVPVTEAASSSEASATESTAPVEVFTKPVPPKNLELLSINTLGEVDLESAIVTSFEKKCKPRPHQIETIHNILVDLLQSIAHRPSSAAQVAPGASPKNYLIQHAAGSGKSLTIAGLTYQLYRLASDGQSLYFDHIFILTDRKMLDAQLGNTISSFMKAQGLAGVVHRSTTAKELSDFFFVHKHRIIVTTIQKFSRVLTTADPNTYRKRIAIIADEAHRSHGRKSTRKLHEVLTGNMRQESSISYFSFTCTPTTKSLQMFGIGLDGKFSPFHTYSLEEALKEGVVLDVLEDYTSVIAKTKIIPKVPEGKEYATGVEAMKTILKAAADHPLAIKEKAQFIVKHFTTKTSELSNDQFQAKGMLVVSGRPLILAYKKLLEAAIAKLPTEKQFDVVAIFTPFELKGKLFREEDPKVNGKHAGYALRRFKSATSKVKFIIVAEKLRTGFDEPKLAVMYIDRTLGKTSAVQTLGRLSRTALGKTKVSVVDFVNSRPSIAKAFGHFFRSTTVNKQIKPDPLKARLDDLVAKMLQVKGVAKQNAKKCVKASLAEGIANKVFADLNTIIEICDNLQMEHVDFSYKFAKTLQATFLEHRASLRDQAVSILDDVSIEVQPLQLVMEGRIDPTGPSNSKSSALRVEGVHINITPTQSKMSLAQILDAAADDQENRIHSMQAISEDFTENDLDFTRRLLHEDLDADQTPALNQRSSAPALPNSGSSAADDIIHVLPDPMDLEPSVSQTNSAEEAVDLPEVANRPKRSFSDLNDSTDQCVNSTGSDTEGPELKRPKLNEPPTMPQLAGLSTTEAQQLYEIGLKLTEKKTFKAGLYGLREQMVKYRSALAQLGIFPKLSLVIKLGNSEEVPLAIQCLEGLLAIDTWRPMLAAKILERLSILFLESKRIETRESALHIVQLLTRVAAETGPVLIQCNVVPMLLYPLEHESPQEQLTTIIVDCLSTLAESPEGAHAIISRMSPSKCVANIINSRFVPLHVALLRLLDTLLRQERLQKGYFFRESLKSDRILREHIPRFLQSTNPAIAAVSTSIQSYLKFYIPGNPKGGQSQGKSNSGHPPGPRPHGGPAGPRKNHGNSNNNPGRPRPPPFAPVLKQNQPARKLTESSTTPPPNGGTPPQRPVL